MTGKVIDNARSIVMHEDEGGFVTTSNLTDYLVLSDGIMEITVECRAVNPAIDKVVRDVRTIDITRAAGVPVFEGDLKREYMAGSIVDLTCTSVGGHPPTCHKDLQRRRGDSNESPAGGQHLKGDGGN
ncbi:uncharacterized protein LOC119597051 [Penaeus monodon]|uniref:uncharacterized protein LOC119597051 n=1 Tax=Penaeus monodon TaxID=6687 RepID=UPI0018A7CDE4|nr:uncharacterized protein LOC119597051 [Penaeus monodon]